MASAKQIDLLIALWTRNGQLREKCATHQTISDPTSISPQLLKDFTAWAREQLMELTPAAASEQIKKANAVLGWEPKASPATSKQRMFIADLEKNAFGRRQTTPMMPLSYSEADAKIRDLKDFMASKKPAKVASVTHLKLVN